MGKLTFAGVSTEDLDLVVQAPPAYTFPEKDVELQHIPGRNGDVIVDNNCYKNVNRVYSIASVFGIALSRDADFRDVNFIEASEKLIQWLHEHKGYQRLEDDYDPDVYRMAMYKEGGSLVDYYGNATALNITFECKPQRFLKSGEVKVVSEGNSTVITNPTYMPSSPEIKLSGFSIDSDHILMMSVTNNSNVVTSIVTINSFPSNYTNLIIDSDKQLVYTINDNHEYINLASSIHLNGMNFPKLEKANNTISVNKYEKEENELNTYSNIIDANKKIIYALYKPYETLIDAKKDYVKIKAYTTLIENKQEIYPAEAYASYCIDRAEHITVESFNNVIQQNCMSINFNSSMFAKPMYGNIQVKPYDEGMYNVETGEVIRTRHYNAGDIVAVYYYVSSPVEQGGYRLFQCTQSYDAKGVNPNDSGWDYSWDTVKNSYWTTYSMSSQLLYSELPTVKGYGWDVAPSDISIPNIETESGNIATKQLILIATEYKDGDELKHKNEYMFLYSNDFTKIIDDHDPDNIKYRYGAFISIADSSDDKLSSNIIKYVGAIDQTDLESSYAVGVNKVARNYYEGITAGHNIFDLFPDLREIINQNHDCSITLYKAKWVYNDSNDTVGHPELDLDDLSDGIIQEKVVYKPVSDTVPDAISSRASEYDESTNYTKGSYCIYLDLYYSCTTPTSGTWDPSKWKLLPYRQGDGTEIIGVNYVASIAGYFYKETQSGTLSFLGITYNKSGWTYVEAGSNLEYVEWDTRKKEFQYGSILSKSGDYKIERYYLSELLDYEDIILEDVFVEDENGNPMIDSAGNKINATIKARFTIPSNGVDDNITKITSLQALYNGYFKLEDSGGNPLGTSNWRSCLVGQVIDVSSYNIKTNKSYRFIFIESAPNYSDEEDFPDWLDPYPILYNSSETQVQTDLDKLNASYYDFIVKKDAYYRYSYFDNNTAKNTEWEYKHIDIVIGVIDPAVSKRSVDEITEINMIEGDENKFPVSQFEYVSHEENSVDDNVYVIVKDISLEEYDSTKTYNINDTAINDYYYYKCLVNNTTGTWDPSKWEVIGIAIEALEFDEETVYNDSDYCIYGRSVYRCTTDNTTGEWSDNNWEFIGNYIKDVGFYYLDDHGEQIEYPGNIPDDWIAIRIVKGSKSDFSDTLLEFYPNADGLYKWDVNLEWVNKEASSEEFITTGNYKSDTYLYYLSDLPAYTGLDSALYDYDIEQANNGNPELVTITVKEDGFYKTSNSTNYMYLKANDPLIKMTIYENPTLTHLELDNDTSLDNMKITITPRWWKL